MRIAALLVGAALVAAACSSTPSAGAPSVSIDSVDVSRDRVSIIVTMGDGEPALVAVDWGDGTAEPGVRGTGTFSFEHTYDANVTLATISATATASDGSVASDVSVVELAEESPTTSIVALDTTTTTSVATTTRPPSTTTSTTTTTQPPTTTSSTTTTTLPAVVEVDLDISKGTIFDQWGSGLQESTWNGKTATAKVVRHKDSWESDGIAVAFKIPASSYEDLKRGSSSLRFDVIVYPVANYVLDTDLSDGNAAEVKWEFMGAFDTTWSSSAKIKKVGAGFLTKGSNGDPFELSWTLDSVLFATPQNVHMFFQCRAKGPGGILVTSDSKCDASLKVNAITVVVTANR